MLIGSTFLLWEQRGLRARVYLRSLPGCLKSHTSLPPAVSGILHRSDTRADRWGYETLLVSARAFPLPLPTAVRSKGPEGPGGARGTAAHPTVHVL